MSIDNLHCQQRWRNVFEGGGAQMTEVGANIYLSDNIVAKLTQRYF